MLGTARVPNTSNHYLQITVEGLWNVDNPQQLVVEQISVPTPITTAGATSPEDRSKERDTQLSAANEKHQHYDIRTFQYTYTRARTPLMHSVKVLRTTQIC